MNLRALIANHSRNFRTVIRFYGSLYRNLGKTRFFLLQGLGLSVGVLSTIGIASLFPILQLVMGNQEDFLTFHVYPHITREHIPAFFLDHLTGVLAGAILTLAFTKLFLTVLYSGLAGAWLERTATELRQKLIDAYQQRLGLTASRSEKTRVLHMNNQLVQFVSFNWALLESSLKLYVLVSIFGLIVVFSTKGILLSVFLIALVLGPVLYPFMRWTRYTATQYYAWLHKQFQHVLISIDGAETIRTLNVEGVLADRLRPISRELIRGCRNQGISRQLVTSLPEFIVVTLAMALVVSSHVQRGNFAVFAIAGYTLIRFVGAFNDFTTRYNTMLELIKAPEEIYGYVEEIDTYLLPKKEEPNRTDLGRFQPIEFRNVSVRQGEKYLLQEISLTFSEGEVIQLVGGNGSGKSTLLRCLLRLAHFSGSIRLGGVELDSIPSWELYQKIAYHSQDNFVFPGTLSENILFGNSSKSEAHLKDLFNNLQLDVNLTFRNGLQYMISEDTKSISGGERQLICILRTLLRDAEVYVFDEFSNHLSAANVSKFLAYIKTHMSGKTVILVSHHLVDESLPKIELEFGVLTT